MSYIFEFSKGESAFILKDSKKTNLNVFKSASPLKRASLHEISAYLKSMKFDANHPLVKLLGVVEAYIKMRKELKELKEFVPTKDKIERRKKELHAIKNANISINGSYNNVFTGITDSSVSIESPTLELNSIKQELAAKAKLLESQITSQLIEIAKLKEAEILVEIQTSVHSLPASAKKVKIQGLLDTELLDPIQKVQVITPMLVELTNKAISKSKRPKNWKELLSLLKRPPLRE